MSDLPLLLPAPRQVKWGAETLTLRAPGLIVVDGPDARCALLFSARRLQSALVEKAGICWEIVGSNAVPHDQVVATLSVCRGRHAPSPGLRADDHTGGHPRGREHTGGGLLRGLHADPDR